MGSKILTMRGSRRSSSTKVSVPISTELMADPVTPPSGITYNRQSIKLWLETGQATCPMKNCILSCHQHPNPNIALRCTHQDLFPANGISSPRAPPSISDVSALLSELSFAIQSGNRPLCILLAGKIKSLAKESKTNKIKSFAAFLAESLLLLVKIIGHADQASRLNAVRLLKYLVQFDVAVAATASIIDGMAEALVSILRDPVSENACRPALVAVFYMASSKEEIAAKYASLGLVPLLLEALVDCEKSMAEKITAVLDVICDSHRGKLTLYDHAFAVPLLVKKILRVSFITTEYSVSVLWKLCKSDEKDEGEGNDGPMSCVREALQLGAFQKLVLLLQVGCGDATKEKACVLLKLLSGPRKSAECS